MSVLSFDNSTSKGRNVSNHSTGAESMNRSQTSVFWFLIEPYDFATFSARLWPCSSIGAYEGQLSPPALSVVRSGENVILSWPSPSTVQRRDLNRGICWSGRKRGLLFRVKRYAKKC